MFGKKKQEEKTILLLDIESGSVGSALLRLSTKKSPKLFGEKRLPLRVLPTLNAHKLSEEMEKGVRSLLTHASEVAARLRHTAPTKELQDIGNVERVAVLLHAPWASVSLDTEGKVATEASDTLLSKLRSVGEELWHTKPLSFHPFGVAAAHMGGHVLPQEKEHLLCIVTGEVVELLVIKNGTILARATIPTGFNTVLRTLGTHAGLSHTEARSAIRIGEAKEPLFAAGAFFTEQLTEATEELLKGRNIDSVYVVSEEAPRDWLGRTLTESENFAELFPQGGTVRTVRPHHFSPHIETHAGTTDLGLLIGTLYVDARFNR